MSPYKGELHIRFLSGFYSARDGLSTDFKFKTWIELISYIANISGQNQDTLNILANSESSWKNTLWGTNFVR